MNFQNISSHALNSVIQSRKWLNIRTCSLICSYFGQLVSHWGLFFHNSVLCYQLTSTYFRTYLSLLHTMIFSELHLDTSFPTVLSFKTLLDCSLYFSRIFIKSLLWVSEKFNISILDWIFCSLSFRASYFKISCVW